MDKNDIINYVMTTPNNPNRAVLEGMLDSIAEAGGGFAEPLIVNGTFDSGTEDYTYEDTTFGEVRQAFESGRPVIIRIVEGITTHVNLVNKVDYTIELGRCTGIVGWKDGGASVYGNGSTATLEELDTIILGTSLA